MQQDIDLFAELRLQYMRKLANDPEFEKEVAHQLAYQAALRAIEDRREKVERRKQKIAEEFEARSKAVKKGWEKRKKREALQAYKDKFIAKRDKNMWPRRKVEHGFGGEFSERFMLCCDIPEPLMGFDLAAELYQEPESRYDSLLHYLRTKRRKDA